jgi:hypothetical protein
MAVLTTCTAEKSSAPGRIPARSRYRGARIEEAAALAQAQEQPLLFLSGVYGIVRSSHPLPWYDHALQAPEVEAMVPRVSAQLATLRIGAVLALMCPVQTPGWPPYHRLLAAACQEAEVSLVLQWTQRC